MKGLKKTVMRVYASLIGLFARSLKALFSAFTFHVPSSLYSNLLCFFEVNTSCAFFFFILPSVMGLWCPLDLSSTFRAHPEGDPNECTAIGLPCKR